MSRQTTLQWSCQMQRQDAQNHDVHQNHSQRRLVSRMVGKPSTQYLNAMTIATTAAIADTGATSIFVMEGADVKNKRPALKPLTINLPDGRQIKLTHICDIDIPGLPTTLTGHIVPHLAIASLFGIRVLCKAG
jgi:hypothetical protein